MLGRPSLGGPLAGSWFSIGTLCTAERSWGNDAGDVGSSIFSTAVYFSFFLRLRHQQPVCVLLSRDVSSTTSFSLLVTDLHLDSTRPSTQFRLMSTRALRGRPCRTASMTGARKRPGKTGMHRQHPMARAVCDGLVFFTRDLLGRRRRRRLRMPVRIFQSCSAERCAPWGVRGDGERLHSSVLVRHCCLQRGLFPYHSTCCCVYVRLLVAELSRRWGSSKTPWETRSVVVVAKFRGLCGLSPLRRSALRWNCWFEQCRCRFVGVHLCLLFSLYRSEFRCLCRCCGGEWGGACEESIDTGLALTWLDSDSPPLS